MGWAGHQVVRRDEHADRRAHDIGVLPARGLAAASCVRAIRVRQRPHRRCLRLGRPRVLRGDRSTRALYHTAPAEERATWCVGWLALPKAATHAHPPACERLANAAAP